MGLIAEVKYKSPSAGVLRDPFFPARIAKDYVASGAQAVSVLVDGPFFGGGEHHLAQVCRAVSVPVLYKEFVVDPWQVWHAAAYGASAVLLIASVLDDEDLAVLLDTCRVAEVEALLEVHNEAEMERACRSGASLIGVNNRNLETFEVSLQTSERLVKMAEGATTLISESGIRSPKEVSFLAGLGFHGVLVGEGLLRQSDLKHGVRALMGELWDVS